MLETEKQKRMSSKDKIYKEDNNYLTPIKNN